MLSSRRALVLAKSGRLEMGDNIFADIIGLSSTTGRAGRAIEFGENAK